MKRIRVTITEEYLLPDSWEIVPASDGELACVRDDGRQFTPDIEWLERQPLVSSTDSATLPGTEWVTVDDDKANWFIELTQQTEVEIRDIE